LQPNIIKAHVREFFTLFFLRFDDKEAAKSFLREISTTLMKSAKQHLMEIEAFKANPSTPGTPYIGHISHQNDRMDGIAKIGIPPADIRV
ncbi:hypothetical protein AB9E11_35530, partial [Rhizobium leguminosarum]